MLYLGFVISYANNVQGLLCLTLVVACLRSVVSSVCLFRVCDSTVWLLTLDGYTLKGHLISFYWIIFEILKSKSVFETPWKRGPRNPNGGGQETYSFSVSLFPLPFFLCLFSYQILRERGGGRRSANYGICLWIYFEINDLLQNV